MPRPEAIWHEALARHGFFTRKPQETIAVDDGLGRILAEPVFALRSSPSYNAAAMDGIAVHFLDLAEASEANPVRLKRDRFRPVNTGNAIPEGCNAVVMIEDVHYVSDTEVELIQPATPWQHVRTIGEDIVATELILPEGHRMRPIDQGAMLATGVTEVEVQRPPKAVVIPTGSELIQPGQPGLPGQIIEFNSRILAGYLNEWGAIASRGTPVADDPRLLKEAILQAAADNDIVVLNAGASAGTRDYTSQVLAEVGEVIVHGVAIKPGKPVILAMVGDTPVIGLPGYPVSAVLTMRLFVREMIASFLGQGTAPDPGHRGHHLPAGPLAHGRRSVRQGDPRPGRRQSDGHPLRQGCGGRHVAGAGRRPAHHSRRQRRHRRRREGPDRTAAAADRGRCHPGLHRQS